MPSSGARNTSLAAAVATAPDAVGALASFGELAAVNLSAVPLLVGAGFECALSDYAGVYSATDGWAHTRGEWGFVRW